MKIITNRPIITTENTDFYSNADDSKGTKKQGIFKRAITGQKKVTGGAVDKYYSDAEIAKRQGQRGAKRADRRTQRGIRKSERVAERKTNRDRRRATRQAKKNARALKKTTKYGKDIYQDKLPKLTQDANGNFIKTNPDGTTIVIPKEQTEIVKDANGNPIVYDKKDLQTPKEVVIVTDPNTKQQELVKEYTTNETEVAVDENGKEQVYKKADVGGMSKGLKIGLIIGASVIGIALVGLIIYKLKKK